MSDKAQELMDSIGWLESNRKDAEDFIAKAEREGNLDKYGWKGDLANDKERAEAFREFAKNN